MKKKNYTNYELLKRFAPYYGNYKFLFITDLFAACLTIVAEIALPIIIRNITNITVSQTSQLTISYLFRLIFIYFILKAIEVGATFYMQRYGHFMGANIERDMRKTVFSHIQYLSDEFYSQTKIGQLLARATTDLFDVTEFAHHCPEEFLVAGVKAITIFIILININVALTLVMFAMLPLMVILTNSTRKRIRKTQNAQRHQIGEINADIEDSLLGIRVIRSFSNEDVEIENFEKSNLAFLGMKKMFYKAMSQFTATTKILDAIMYLTVVTLGGVFLIQGKINSGDFIVYTMYTSTLLASVTRLINFIETFEKGLSGIERYAEIMDVQPSIVDKENPIVVDELQGDIKFNNVSFAYNNHRRDDKKTVLQNINIDIKKGSKVALVGPSGGGKTTLTNLIPRFYDIDSGSITIDGYDIRDLELKTLRDNIGIVQQDVYMFSGTVFDNIIYGDMKANKDQVIEAAKLAGAYEFIEKLPYGFDTYVGERGVMLSGGQKQRISIARVFLKNPPILILDEATSALDNKSEQIVQESLQKLAEGRTTITIAHRLSTIISSDEIIVLTEDGIQEKGNHRQLLEKKGVYYSLYNRLDNQIMGWNEQNFRKINFILG